MTAREIAKDMNCEIEVIEGDPDYVFTKEELSEFVGKICKQQRELCVEHAELKEAKTYMSPSGYEATGIDKDSILNAPTPFD